MAVYTGGGLQFSYPDAWTATEERHGDDVSIHLQTPGAAFWSLSLVTSGASAEDVVQEVVATYRAEYADVDVYPASLTGAAAPCVACDLDFVYLDLVNSVALRAVETDEATLLIVYQGDAAEFAQWRSEWENLTARVCAQAALGAAGGE